MRISSFLIAMVALAALSGCADRVPLDQAMQLEPAGFLRGCWHGLILPFAWLISLFEDSVGIYAVRNTGRLYDLGFMIGVFVLGGGSAAGASK